MTMDPLPPSNFAPYPEPASFSTGFRESPFSLSGHDPTERILWACNNPETRIQIAFLFRSKRYGVRETDWKTDFASRLPQNLEVALLDTIGVPDRRILEICGQLRTNDPDRPILLLDEPNRSEEYRTEIEKWGCWSLFKPCHPLQTLSAVEQGMRLFRLVRENRAWKKGAGHASVIPVLPSLSKSGQQLASQVESLGKLGGTLLIEGEPGTGKSTIAMLLHRNSPRSDQAFYAVSCSGMSSDFLESDLFGSARTQTPGKLELLSDGTIFLDHVEFLSHRVQGRLVAFLKNRKSGVRILASTRQGLTATLCRERLRMDLLGLLGSLVLEVPPLRRRSEDVPEFGREILAQLSRHADRASPELSDGALDKLMAHSWPGNLRELEAVLERGMKSAQYDVVSKHDLVFDPCFQGEAEGLSLAGRTIDSITKQALVDSLKVTNGNRVLAANMLGISEKTVYNKIRQYKLKGHV